MSETAQKLKIVVPQQPSYQGWPGYFARLLGADHLVLMDDVQFNDGGWQNRNYIWDPIKGRRLLTIPVKKKNRFGQSINEVEIADTLWADNHLHLIGKSYQHKTDRQLFDETLRKYYTAPYGMLTDATNAFIQMILTQLQINVTVSCTSQLNITGTKTDRLVDICAKTGCNVMRVGQGALKYLDTQLIREAGIRLETIHAKDRPLTQFTNINANQLSITDTLYRHGGSAKGIIRASHTLSRVC